MDLSLFLDEICSTRTTLTRRSAALASLEQLLATICISTSSLDNLNQFLDAQNSFENNVASRVVSAMAAWLPALHNELNRISDKEEAGDVEDLQALVKPMVQALNIVQGVALLHAPSKAFLGRLWCIQLLLDLLLLSRHIPNPSSTESLATTSNEIPSPSLASSVLDTLLCIMVDSPTAFRSFEDVGGLDALVRTLKRSRVSREVRMKCLEFLYFYLLPEQNTSSDGDTLVATTDSKFNPIPEDNKPKKSPPPKIRTDITFSPDADFAPNPRAYELNLLHSDLDFVPKTPKRAQVAALGLKTPQRLQHRRPQNGESISGDYDHAKSLFDIKTPHHIKERVVTKENKESAVGRDLSNVPFIDSTPSKRHRKVHTVDWTSPTRAGVQEQEDIYVFPPPRKLQFLEQSPRKPKTRTGPGLNAGQGLGIRGSSLGELTDNSKEHRGKPILRSHSLEEPYSGKSTSEVPALGRNLQARVRSTAEKKELLGMHLADVDVLVDGMRNAGAWGLA